MVNGGGGVLSRYNDKHYCTSGYYTNKSNVYLKFGYFFMENVSIEQNNRKDIYHSCINKNNHEYKIDFIYLLATT